ncbi:MAG: Wzz/FepE/Etk N-terminal domain-containing protein [Candidatus Acidiferrales bacterium]
MSSVITDEAIGSARPKEEVSVLDLFWLLYDRRRILLIGTAAFTLCAVLIALLLPKRYTATTVILPPQRDQSMQAALLSQASSGLGMLGSLAQQSLGLKNPNDMQVALIESRTVQDALVQRFDLRKVYRDKRESDARKDLEHNTTIDSGLKDGLIHISVTDKSPDRAEQMANGYVDAYRKLSDGLAVSEASQRRLFFDQELGKESDKLADAEEALAAVEMRTGLIEPQGQATAVIQSVAALRSQIAAKEVQVEAMRKFAANENPDLQLAEQELATLRQQLAQMGADTNTQSGEFLMPKGTVPQASLEYARRLRDVKYEETIFSFLETQYELAKIDEAKEGSVIQVVDPAVRPDKRSGPPRLLIILGGLFGGLLLMVLWIFFTETVSAAKKDPKARELLDSLLPRRNKTANA